MRSQTITIYGVRYKSIAEAANRLNVLPSTIRAHPEDPLQHYGMVDEARVRVGRPKRITVNGVDYDSITEAAEALHMEPSHLAYRVRNASPNEDITRRRPRHGVYVFVNGIRFVSLSEAAQTFKVGVTELYKRRKEVVAAGGDPFNFKFDVPSKTKERTPFIPVTVNRRKYNSLSELSRATGVNIHTLWARYKKGERGKQLIRPPQSQLH